MAIEFNPREVLEEDIAILNNTKDSIKSEGEIAAAKSKALTSVVAVIHQEIFDKKKEINRLLDEIKEFHDRRLSTQSDLNDLNEQMTLTEPESGPEYVTKEEAERWDPNTSPLARDFLATKGKVAWRSRITLEKTPIEIRVAGAGEEGESGEDLEVKEENDHKWVISTPGCRSDGEWDGKGYAETGRTDENGRAIVIDLNRVEYVVVPNNVCPPDDIILSNIGTREDKAEYKIYGYELKEPNPIVTKRTKLTSNITGLGTITEYDPQHFVFDRGVNSNGNSWTHRGQTYSGNPTTHSYTTERLARIRQLKSEINGGDGTSTTGESGSLLYDANRIMDARIKHDLYKWSLDFLETDETAKADNLKSLVEYFTVTNPTKGTELGFYTGNIENEVSVKDIYKDLTEEEKQNLSVEHGLGYVIVGIQTETKINENGEEVVVIVYEEDENGKPTNNPATTRNTNHENYNPKLVKEYIENNKSEFIFGDNIGTKKGSITIIDSNGNEVTYTGLTSQINHVTSGAMNLSNTVASTLELEDIPPPGSAPRYNLTPPGVGLGLTYSGTIGIGTTAQWDSVYARVYYGHLRGSAYKASVGVITEGDDYDYTVMLTSVPTNSTTGIASQTRMFADPNLSFNPSTGVLSLGSVVVEEITISGGSGAIGAAKSVLINDGANFPNYEERGRIGFVTSGIGTFSSVYTVDGLSFNPTAGELFASKFIGIGSFTNLKSGISTFTSAIIGSAITISSSGIDATGIVTIGSSITLNSSTGIINAVGAAFSGNVSIAGTLTYEDVTNVDSIGIVTARKGIEVGEPSSIGATIFSNGSAIYSGIITSTKFSGDIDATYAKVGTAITIATNTTINSNGITASKGSINNLGGINLNYTGIGTFGELSVTSLSVTNLDVSSIGTVTNLNSTNSKNSGISSVTGQQVVKNSNIENLIIKPLKLTANGNDADSTFDTISYSTETYLRNFNDGDVVQYISPSGDPYVGLTDGNSYYVQNVGTGNSFKLYTNSNFTNLVEVADANNASGIHTFRKVSSGIATITKLVSPDTTITDTLTVSGLATITNAHVGYSTVNNLWIEGEKAFDEFNITNFVYDKSSGLSTITVDSNINFVAGDIIRLSGIAFTCSDEHIGVTTTIFPDGTQGFEYVVISLVNNTEFTTNVGISTIGHTYDSGGVVQFGLNNKFKFPTSDGKSGQYMVTDGAGNLSFRAPDQFGGNRLYVSAKFGNDLNDGVNAPLKTIKRASELASLLSYDTPVTIYVASGNYVENNPIILPENTSVVGDGLRRGIIRPLNRDRDIFRVRNACYITNLQFRDYVNYPDTQYRNDVIDKAAEYAKILVNGETETSTNYRTGITTVTTPAVSIASTETINNRIDSLITVVKNAIENEQTELPQKTEGNTDSEFVNASILIANNIGSSANDTKSAYIPGNAVGWSTESSGAGFAITDEFANELESDIFTIFSGIVDDLRYGGSFGTEYTSKKLKELIVGTPEYTWDYVVAFDDPTDTFIDRRKYVGLSSDKPRITQSPYIQNCSIISFLGGNGVNVDGSKIQTDNIPIVGEEAENPLIGDVPDQGKSMVANAFTTVSFGGIGWKVSNGGYAQVVSCFQIFCQIGSYAQSGGYLSITNSATNFGIYALRATGFRPKPFEFDKGIIFETGASGDSQTMKIGGLGRSDQELYVLRFIRASDGDDRTEDFKAAGLTTSLSGSDFNISTDVINIGSVGDSLNDGDGLNYTAPNSQSIIGGLVDDATYYVQTFGIGRTEAYLYVDEDLNTRVNITSAPTGTHIFTKTSEEFFVSEITSKHRVYQDLTLDNAIGTGVTFYQGTQISQVRPDNAVAVGFAVTWTTSILTVSVENSIDVNGNTTQLLFQTGVDAGTIDDVNGLESNITSVASRADLHTINVKTDSTRSDSSIQNISTLPITYKCNLHRPSTINSSAHTWEYAGSGTDYNALPENGGQTRERFEQYNENGGRVFTSGTNELGDFKVGDSITAFNRTGNIVFNNRVTIGTLDSLELSLSGGVTITEISTSEELGVGQVGGPGDQRLPTQKSVYNYIQNHLGSFIDVNKSTTSTPSAVPQLNSQGLLSPDVIPAVVRFNNVFETNVSGGRTDFVNQIPPGEILKSDIVVESPTSGIGTETFTLIFEDDSQFLVLSSNTENYEFFNGDEIRSSQNGAVGIVTFPTHPSYGTTGYVRGVINTISVTDNGSGYTNAGIYTGVSLTSISGVGTDATADITVNNGSVENVNIILGGRYYAANDTFRADPNDIGGVDATHTEFTASVTNVDTRLYVKLTGDKTQFAASQAAPDFIADGRSGTISTSFTETETQDFDPSSFGSGGDVFLAENCIELPTNHEFVDGDAVQYKVTVGTPVSNLVNLTTYFIKTIGVSSVRLAEDYAGNSIVDLTSSGSGTHQLIKTGISTAKNRISVLNHGFTTGNSVKLIATNPPAGLVNNGIYFVGSVTTDSFTLHDVRQDALLSVNGQTFNEINLTSSGSGTGDFQEQNVTFINTINTSSNNTENFSVLNPGSDIDAQNIISGTISANRLANGTPDNTKFLRGDSQWEYAVQTISVGTGNTSALVVTTGNPGGVIAGSGINTYYGNISLNVSGVTTTGVGNSEFSTLGASRFKWRQSGTNKGPFKVTGTDSVDLQSTLNGSNDNGIDAIRMEGQSLATIVNLGSSNINGHSRGVLAAANGGLGANVTTNVLGQMLVSSTTNKFTTTSDPMIAGSVGIGFYDNSVGAIQGTLDINQVSSMDTSVTTIANVSTASTIFQYNKNTFRTAKFVISCKRPNYNWVQSSECLVVNTSLDAFITEYASVINSNNTNSQIATFDADIDGDNVRLLATPTSSTYTLNIKVVAISLIRDD